MDALQMSRCYFGAGAVLMAALTTGSVQAAVVISDHVTKNMICSNGVCSPTANDAVLNTGDLETLLALGNLKVTARSPGVDAEDIEVSGAFGWKAGSRLELDASQSTVIDAAVSVLGNGGFIASGPLSFGRNGHVSFADLSSTVSLTGTGCGLKNSIKSLAEAFARHPGRCFALAGDYDAAKDGTYDKSPIGPLATGSAFAGMGHTISNLKIVGRDVKSGNLGLFETSIMASINGITLRNASVTLLSSAHQYGSVGTLVGANAGWLSDAHATGTVTVFRNMGVGGLVGGNSNRGDMSDDDANVTVRLGANSVGGGLAGYNGGPISECYALGSVTARGDGAQLGGLVGWNSGQIENSYARGSARGGSYAGGLIGFNILGTSTGLAASSYSTGKVAAALFAGGLIGTDESQGEYIEHTYWDTSTSNITNPGQGAGLPPNDPGITGLTTKQLRSGLPRGFHPFVWAEDPKINDGLPYLLADPPE